MENKDENRNGGGKMKKEKRRENICLMDGLKGLLLLLLMFVSVWSTVEMWVGRLWVEGEASKKCVTWKRKLKNLKKKKKAQICRDNFSPHYRVCGSAERECFKGTRCLMDDTQTIDTTKHTFLMRDLKKHKRGSLNDKTNPNIAWCVFK